MAFASGLPADLAITDRSRKFYDGTYRCNSKGFTDEQGVYRNFDCLDPLGRAPTPMPPIFSDDEDDDRLDVTTGKPADSIGKDTDATSATAAVESETPCLKFNRDIVTEPNSRGPRSPGSIRRFAIGFLTNSEQSKIFRQDKLDTKPQKSNAIVSKPEGIVSASKQAVSKEAVVRTHDLHSEPPLANTKNNDVKMPDTPPESPVNAVTGVLAISPASTLSSVPSNLSEQDRDFNIKVKATSLAAQDSPSPPSTPSKTPARSRAKATTRGVAQKITKDSKRADSSKPSLPKQKENSFQEFSLRELHAMGSRGGRSLRKSVR